jgi:hypothetical protein
MVSNTGRRHKMKKLIFLAFVIAIISAGCTKTDTKVTATINNTSTNIVVEVYNGNTDLGTVGIGESAAFILNKDTCLDLEEHQFGSYLSTVNSCFSNSRTETIE